MDKKLRKKILKGDKAAFKQFYDDQIDKALRVAIVITKNKELAKEATQETFIRVYRNLSSYDVSQPFDPWFFRILTNECNRIMKKESKVTKLSDYFDQEVEDTSAYEEVDHTELYDAISTLDDLYRVPIILKYLKGYSEKEIAEILEANQNTIKSRLYKGRELLKKRLINNNSGRNYNV
jgi:RNA polymerase sigma factor (sigma-70 family)